MIVARKIHINGIVQGVGFRPFVYALAKRYQLTGWVKNSSSGVDIVANGEILAISEFLLNLKDQAPPLSQIDEFLVEEVQVDSFQEFAIIPSETVEGEFIPVSPDVSICPDCLAELNNPEDRRYHYPFINCTNCGPRFTIIRDIPYDRPLTNMAPFKMCKQCGSEYEDPLNRRFHAQPVACPDCGPMIWFERKEVVADKLENEETLQVARDYIRDGKIIAVKGLGGFHLACDATNPNAVDTLRSRKKRSDKPFALMVPDVETARKYCHVSESEQTLLESRARPIVILDRQNNVNLPQAIAPNVNTLGIMLPYTPLHYLLIENGEGFPDVLVMTSGNISDEPIVYTNSSARHELEDIADGYLLNDREIETRLDDSVIMELHDHPYFYRRSRGYAPSPIKFKQDLGEILAAGAELKNTFCLTRGKYAFLSHHIGDMENLETLRAYEEGIPHYEHIFKVKTEAIACDMHPDYLSSRYASERSCVEDIPLFPVQHHHAHLAAVLADNRWETTEPVIGISLDGTGYGLDGKIWGGEILYGGYAQFERKFHLEYMPLPGGDAATHNPDRIAAAYLWKSGIDWAPDIPAISSYNSDDLEILRTQLEKNINCPQTSSMGRLFDAVAGLIGLRRSVNYEAQAAIELENAIEPSIHDTYCFEISDDQILLGPLLNNIVSDIHNGKSVGVIAAKFHNSVRNLVLLASDLVYQETGCKIVALSGGVWQNRYLIRNAMDDLQREGFKVLVHHDVPANDGGIALGQALAANYMMKG
jgi:hydrogenase maturation protein HypF